MFADFNAFKQQLMLPQLFNGGVEMALNELIRRTKKCEPYLRKLNNKVLAVHFQLIDLQIYFIFSTQRIDLLRQYEGTADCAVDVASHLLFKFPKKSELSQYINDKSIVLNGDLQVLQDFVALVEFLEKDPAELLSHYIGDVAAYSTVNFGRKVLQTLKFKTAQSQRYWGERLTEEYELIAPKLAIADFCDQVKTLEKQTALLEQKMNNLR